MRLPRPKHTADSVARELIRGLEGGWIALPAAQLAAGDPPREDDRPAAPESFRRGAEPVDLPATGQGNGPSRSPAAPDFDSTRRTA